MEVVKSEQQIIVDFKYSLGLCDERVTLLRNKKPLICKQHPQPYLIPSSIGGVEKKHIYCGEQCPLFQIGANKEGKAAAIVSCGCNTVGYTLD